VKLRFRKTYTSRDRTWSNPQFGKWVVKSTLDMIRDGGYKPDARPYQRHSIPVAEPLQLSKKDLFDPYYVGLFIGNGSVQSITFNAKDKDCHAYALKYGNNRQSKPGAIVAGVSLSAFNKISELNLNKISYEKTIPEEYLWGSIDQRKNLLAGLMDSDGTTSADGAVTSYSTTSRKLAESFSRLVTSLGGIAQTKKRAAGYKADGVFKRCRDVYVIQIWMTFNPYRSKRKYRLWREILRDKHERVIHKIEFIGKKKMRCISVAAKDGSYLCDIHNVVTHNSSTAIRKNIHWATSPDLWPELWPGLPKNGVPNLFWYFYPNLSTATTEYETKWQFFLPKNEFKDHPVYGWKEEWEKGYIHAIRFNSGVYLQFKTYTMKVKDIQASSVYLVTCDEEMPVEFLAEIKSRLNATDGYLLSVFTATLGQMHWQMTMEPPTPKDELHRDALKLQVSLYDSQVYEDGSVSPWTNAKIERAKANCPTEAEVQRRIYGRFVKSHGLKFEAFSIENNLTESVKIPPNWKIFEGVDIGSGGQSGHPAAVAFIAVSSDNKQGRVVRV